uniref:hypothetical protein n=1 Tax=uncultured Bacteroides sp. TaxID=162156 RepID=UPI0026012C21|nr:hypothetical protein [uncultured Bacteroides sp.]
MRKVLLLFATLLLTMSCNNNQKVQTKNEISNTPTATEIRKQEIQDSLKQVEIDSLALIAWGDVKFGMSMKEALNTETFENGDKYDNSITMEFNNERNFKKTFGLNELTNFWGDFTENELTKIRIESYHFTANHLDDLISDCDIFINNFTQKYGKPSFKKDKVNISEFNSGEEFEYAKFQVGDKSITILLGEWDLEVNYYYEVLIENHTFPKKKRIKTEKEKREEQKQMEKAEKIRNNSF